MLYLWIGLASASVAVIAALIGYGSRRRAAKGLLWSLLIALGLLVILVQIARWLSMLDMK